MPTRGSARNRSTTSHDSALVNGSNPYGFTTAAVESNRNNDCCVARQNRTSFGLDSAASQACAAAWWTCFDRERASQTLVSTSFMVPVHFLLEQDVRHAVRRHFVF